MGSGSYSSEAYSASYKSRGYGHKSEDELFKNSLKADASTLACSFNVKARTNNTNIRPEMVPVGIRESRDTEEHKHTTPIIIAFDVTGSMSSRPKEMIEDQFPKLMDKLIQLGVKDPQLLFLAIGDHEFDDYPLQAGQFESDTNKILDSIQAFHLEKGGGPNWGETYSLAWVMAGFHTETDSYYKRHRKGFLFTLGDEPCLPYIPGEDLVHIMGYQDGAQSITSQAALEKAKEQYEVFHIHVTNASHSLKEVERSWKMLIGDDRLLSAKSTEIADTIADTIKSHYIPEPDDEESENVNQNVNITEENRIETPKPEYEPVGGDILL